MPSFYKMKKYTSKEILTSIRRLNRVLKGFYTEETEDLDLSFLDSPTEVSSLLLSKYSITHLLLLFYQTSAKGAKMQDTNPRYWSRGT